MSSAPSVPGVEVGASWLGGCEQVLTAGALELLAALHRMFGPRRAELPESRVVRDAELAGRRCPDSWPGGGTCGGRPRWPRAWSIGGSRSPALADREMVMGEPMPVARIMQLLGASIQGVPVGRHLADALDGPGRRVWHSTRTAALTR